MNLITVQSAIAAKLTQTNLSSPGNQKLDGQELPIELFLPNSFPQICDHPCLLARRVILQFSYKTIQKAPRDSKENR